MFGSHNNLANFLNNFDIFLNNLEPLYLNFDDFKNKIIQSIITQCNFKIKQLQHFLTLQQKGGNFTYFKKLFKKQKIYPIVPNSLSELTAILVEIPDNETNLLTIFKIIKQIQLELDKIDCNLFLIPNSQTKSNQNSNINSKSSKTPKSAEEILAKANKVKIGPELLTELDNIEYSSESQLPKKTLQPLSPLRTSKNPSRNLELKLRKKSLEQSNSTSQHSKKHLTKSYIQNEFSKLYSKYVAKYLKLTTMEESSKSSNNLNIKLLKLKEKLKEYKEVHNAQEILNINHEIFEINKKLQKIKHIQAKLKKISELQQELTKSPLVPTSNLQKYIKCIEFFEKN